MTHEVFMEVLVTSSVRKPGIRLALVRRVAEEVLRAEGREHVEVAVLLVGKRAMKSLNERYTGRRGTTDVLAFEMAGEKFSGSVLGDVYVCVDVARTQAKASGEPVRKSIARLVVHGLLHLAGYDHTRGKRDAKRMEDRQEALLDKLFEIGDRPGSCMNAERRSPSIQAEPWNKGVMDDL
jgi:probable rRNA maturation factor